MNSNGDSLTRNLQRQQDVAEICPNLPGQNILDATLPVKDKHFVGFMKLQNDMAGFIVNLCNNKSNINRGEAKCPTPCHTITTFSNPEKEAFLKHCEKKCW